jgi:hypothetical protein
VQQQFMSKLWAFSNHFSKSADKNKRRKPMLGHGKHHADDNTTTPKRQMNNRVFEKTAKKSVLNRPKQQMERKWMNHNVRKSCSANRDYFFVPRIYDE